MVRRNNATALQLESLEAREVPAIFIAGATLSGTTTVLPSGTITVSEIALNNQTTFAPNNMTSAPTTRSATADDNVTFSFSGSTLTITSSDGIFATVNMPGFQPNNFGNTVTINNVTGLNVNLQLGGNDSVSLAGTGTLTAPID